jgi:hypothetical protein
MRCSVVSVVGLAVMATGPTAHAAQNLNHTSGMMGPGRLDTSVLTRAVDGHGIDLGGMNGKVIAATAAGPAVADGYACDSRSLTLEGNLCSLSGLQVDPVTTLTATTQDIASLDDTSLVFNSASDIQVLEPGAPVEGPTPSKPSVAAVPSQPSAPAGQEAASVSLLAAALMLGRRPQHRHSTPQHSTPH